jgi:hypothetical protein
MSNQNLVRVSTYAKIIDKSTAWVYKLIEKEKVKAEIIDEVIFINMEVSK